MSKIKNIIFDLGGVIVDLDTQRCMDGFHKLGLPEIAELINPYHPAAMIGEMEHGDLTFHEMCDKMRAYVGRDDIRDEDIAWAYNQLLVGLDVKKLRLLDRLRKRGYKIYALSNNNPMSIQTVHGLFAQDGKTMEDYFDRMFLSFELRSLKPGREIYEKMIAMSGMRPEESLFLDDSEVNVNVARELGFSVYKPEVGEDFAPIFDHMELFEEAAAEDGCCCRK